MKLRSRLRIVIGIVIALIALGIAIGLVNLPTGVRVSYWRGVYRLSSPAKDLDALKAVHKATAVRSPSSGKLGYEYTSADRSIIASDSAKCIACHGYMTDLDESGKPEHYIHRKMLTAPMLNFSCTDCHKQVDIRKRSPSHVTFRVQRQLCAKCHNPKKASLPAEWTAGRTWGSAAAPEMPPLMEAHGTDEKSGRQWIKNHPRVATAVGVDQCRECHKPGSELDFCRVCHLRGGFRPTSHKVLYSVTTKQIYPESSRTNVVQTRWKGYHFVVAREALAKLGVKVNSPKELPLDAVSKLPCGACHVVQEWCTRCHIKHNPNWLDPNVGHPSYVAKYGSKYCFRCHDPGGSKCTSCHSFVGQLTKK